ncbi:BglG family transcription antiterminator [Streptococcus merionis]|uniref:BglG family transcription antiterminator n=1 Tax=Streptococcus merionis TaxID=400065 RepID=UPI0035131A86
MKERSTLILNKLLTSKFPIPLKRFETDFSVSARTIRNDIAAINEFLAEKGFPLIFSVRSQGITLHLTAEQECQLKTELEIDDATDFLNRDERHLDMLLDLAFGKEKVFLYKKERFYQISKSTMDEDMRQFRQLLKPYQIDVVSHPKDGLLFKGQESAIRVMLFTIISQELVKSHEHLEGVKSRIINRYLPEKILVKLDGIFDFTISKREASLYRTYFNLFTAIWMLRLTSGHYINEDQGEVVDISLSEWLELYLTQINREFSLSISKIEKNYIAFILKTFNMQEAANPNNWLQLQMLVIQLIHFVEEKTKIPFSQKERQLQKALYNHMIGMVARVKNGIQLTNPLTDRIKHSYGVIYLAVKEFSKQLSQLFQLEIIDDEVAFLTIHFSTALSEINQANHGTYRAVVICNQGLATGKLLAENLKEFFNIEILAILNSREIDIIQKLDVDLVFSTIEIDYQAKPLLVLDSIIQEDTKVRVQQFLTLHKDKQIITAKSSDFTQLFMDILKIMEEEGPVSKITYEQVQALFQKNHLRINKREVQPMIEDILTDDKIMICQEKTEWRGAIKYVSNPLKEQDIITDAYIVAMIKSVEEYGPYIVIAPGLALAHARPDDGAKQLGLSLAIFEEPVLFESEDQEDQEVYVIFCLSAVDAFSHLNVMKSLVNLMRDTDKIERLSQARDIETVKNILFHSKEEN